MRVFDTNSSIPAPPQQLDLIDAPSQFQAENMMLYSWILPVIQFNFVRSSVIAPRKSVLGTKRVPRSFSDMSQ